MGCHCSKPMPGAAVLARNARAAGVRVVRALMVGQPVMADRGTIGQRRAICQVCAHCRAVEKNGTTYHRCDQCGCWLDGKFFAKWALATESCPRDLWPQPSPSHV